MSDDRVQCPDCLTRMPESALFCPGCGRPRSQVLTRLKVASERMGVPYELLLERVQNGTLLLSSLPAADDNPPGQGRDGVLVLLVLAALVVSGVLWVAGAQWLVVASVIVWLAIAYGKAQSRVDRAEGQLRSLEARIALLTVAAPAATVSPVVLQASATSVVVPEPDASPTPTVPPEQSTDEVVDERPGMEVTPDQLPSPEPDATPFSSAAQTAPASPPETNPLAAEAFNPPSRRVTESAVERREGEEADTGHAQHQAPQVGSEWWSGDLEQLLSGRVLAWVGGLAIMIGAVFFLSLAFSRGWIGPGARVLIGIVASTMMVGGGAWFFERRERVLGHVLVAVGLGVMSVSMLAATVLYDLLPSAAGLAGTLVAALAAAAIAVRANTQVVAIFGLIAALAAPPIQNAPVAATTMLFLVLVLCGTTAIALHRSWSWLPPVAFLLTAPQIAAWILDEASIAGGLVALSGFWLLNAIAAGGEEYRLRDADRALRPASATLLLANVAFLVACGFTLIEPDAEGGRALFLVAVALAHAVIAGWFVRSEGDRHPFGLLAAGTGLAAFSIAIPVWLGGAVVAIAWAAEAVALTWVATLRRHSFSAVVATMLGLGSIAHLGLFEYPFWEIFGNDLTDRAFFNGSGMTLAFILGAMGVAGAFSRWRELRIVLGVIGFALLIYAMPFELSGIALLGAWSALTVLASAVCEWQERIPGFGGEFRIEARYRSIEGALTLAPAVAAGTLVTLHALIFELPILDLPRWDRPETPFWTEQTAAALILITASLAVAFVSRSVTIRLAGITAAFGIAAYLMPFELETTPMLLAWVALTLAQFVLPRVMPVAWEPGSVRFGVTGGVALVGLGFLVAANSIAHPEMMLDSRSRPFWSEATATLGALAMVLGIGFWLHRTTRESRLFALGAVAILAYLIPIELQATGTVIGWALLAIVPLLLVRWRAGVRETSRNLCQLAAALLLAMAALVDLVLVVPPTRLFVDAASRIDHPFFWSSATATLGVLAGVLIFAAWLHRADRHSRTLSVLIGVTIVYLLSVGVVDIFQTRVGGETALESLQKQAQVALSILWTVLGVGLFVTGIVERSRPLRIAGLSLLGLSTAKVFVYDLASLDASYRVLSFIGLGVLLLVSSWAYQRAIAPEPRRPDGTPPPSRHPEGTRP